jgi:Uma2 family endonuclease
MTAPSSSSPASPPKTSPDAASPNAPEPDTARHWTVADVLALPSDDPAGHHELLDGTLITTPAPSWRHEVIVRALLNALCEYLGRFDHQQPVFIGSADIWWNDDNLLRPDIVIASPHGRDGQYLTAASLLLVVDVARSAQADGHADAKRRHYQSLEVETYWHIGSDDAVEIWRPDSAQAERATDMLMWQAAPGLAPMLIDLRALMALGRPAGRRRRGCSRKPVLIS